MISACTLSLLFAATFLAAPLVNQDRCGYPPRLASAELMDAYKEKDFFPVGSIVKYKCRPGYMKNPGMYSSRCKENQQWSKVLELCKRRTCGYPGEPVGGRLLVTGDFDLGSTANYQCDEGHRLIGKSTRKCKVVNNKMEWSDEVPVCEIIPCLPPPKIPHGKHTGEYLDNFYYATLVIYSCDKGYPLIGNSSIICISKDGVNGEWSGRASCGVTECPSPQIKNGRIVSGVSSTYKYNKKVSFECIGGYEMVGSREIHCQVDGTWDPPKPVCEQMVQCPPPPDIQNGMHNNQKTGIFPSGIFVKYTCNPGYALIGEETLNCTNAGKWSSPAPNCEARHLSSHYRISPSNVPGLSFSCPSIPDMESPASYPYCSVSFFKISRAGSCCLSRHPGEPVLARYRLIGKSSRSCALFGKTVAWTDDLPYCQMTQCPYPQIKNGRIAAGISRTYKYNQKVSFECTVGYKMVGSREIYCQGDGTWDPPIPVCEQGCVNPDIQNGRIIRPKANDQSVSTITFECDSGYTMKGNHTIRCQHGNTWDSPAPVCVRVVQCQQPPKIQNGIHNNQETLFPIGMLVKYTCNPGYALIGEATIQCMDSGTWSSLAPNCEEIECKSPPDIQNGVHSNQEVMVFKRGMCVKYTCNFGYTLIGDATIHCTDSGTWTFPAPHCKKSQCPFPPSIANGKHDSLALKMFTSEMSVTYYCDPGYLLIGKASITCGPSGNWSLPVPSCEVMHCPVPPKIIHGKHVGEDFTYGKSVFYICDAGYSHIGNYSVMCIRNSSNSVKWSEAPRCQGCLAPPNVTHSKRDKTTLEDFPYGTSVTYHCDPGFFLIGAPTIYCQTSGTWNQPVPQCKRKEYTEATKLPSDSQMTKDRNNQIEKKPESFIKDTIHSKINKTSTKDLATTFTPGLGGQPDIQRLPEQFNGGNQTDQLNGGNQTDAFPEFRNCSGEVDGCPLPPLSVSTRAEKKV
ncbi:PREDICTED: complement receptor type 2-like [Thamnophis sirtalis]|uniref:Complement receptor type 2-like n=1 Tax=Thamnophis sirtalis TaxID=35019 RepID=A0A6I9Z077_9SAUR|nr:PREDICTED: complement receptor type 2-like [Thamnophis sirtalis]